MGNPGHILPCSLTASPAPRSLSASTCLQPAVSSVYKHLLHTYCVPGMLQSTAMRRMKIPHSTLALSSSGGGKGGGDKRVSIFVYQEKNKAGRRIKRLQFYKVVRESFSKNMMSKKDLGEARE